MKFSNIVKYFIFYYKYNESSNWFVLSDKYMYLTVMLNVVFEPLRSMSVELTYIVCLIV